MRIPRFFLMALLSLFLTLVGASTSQVIEEAAPKTPPNQTSFKVLYTFAAAADGERPTGVMLDPMGNLYGTTGSGGVAPCPGYFGCGTVFKLTQSGLETVLYNFSGEADGGYPQGGVVQDDSGNLYGTALTGGDTNCSSPSGCGVVFKLDPVGMETVLHSFEGQPGDGANPGGMLTRDEAGNLYGTTFSGGPSNLGTVFELDASGTETVLYSFGSSPDGAHPESALLRSSSGDFYGTTELGGLYGYGTVFKLDAVGQETVLYSFGPMPDGNFPRGETLVLDGSGDLYGTTEDGGAFGYGTVFRLTPTGDEIVLYSFRGERDGAFPFGGVARDKAGNLYGTTSAAGASHYYGTVFRLDPAGNLAVLHSFTGGEDGGNPYSPLVQDPAGNLYGTTNSGVWGKVFELTP